MKFYEISCTLLLWYLLAIILETGYIPKGDYIMGENKWNIASIMAGFWGDFHPAMAAIIIGTAAEDPMTIHQQD